MLCMATESPPKEGRRLEFECPKRRKEQSEGLDRVVPFSVLLVSILRSPPFFFSNEFYDIFLGSPLHLSLLGIFPRQVPQCFRGDGFNCSVGIGWLCGARLFN